MIFIAKGYSGGRTIEELVGKLLFEMTRAGHMDAIEMGGEWLAVRKRTVRGVVTS